MNEERKGIADYLLKKCSTYHNFISFKLINFYMDTLVNV